MRNIKSAFETYKLDIPEEQIDRVFGQDLRDIDYSFIGFMDVYQFLSKIIAKHWKIIDLGCAYAPQSFFFKNHLTYIGVDISKNIERFYTDRTVFFEQSIQDYIKGFDSSVDLENTFAICNYVPDREAREMVKDFFPNNYVYYPTTIQEEIKDGENT